MSTFLVGDPSDVGMKIEQAESAAKEQEFLNGIQDDVRARIARGQPYGFMRLNLTSATPEKWSGGVVYGVCYRKEGAEAGGRLDVSLGGGEFKALYPGARLVGLFGDIVVKRSASSATSGTAELVLLLRRDVDFQEPAEIAV